MSEWIIKVDSMLTSLETTDGTEDSGIRYRKITKTHIAEALGRSLFWVRSCAEAAALMRAKKDVAEVKVRLTTQHEEKYGVASWITFLKAC